MNVGIFGLGYVGLVTGACLAEMGNDVAMYDCDTEKVRLLERGRVPFYEPELPALLQRNRLRLTFTEEPSRAVSGRDVVFIAVGTPSAADGRADLAGVCGAARTIAASIDRPTVVANKSTVPAETADYVERTVRSTTRELGVRVVSNPEFLREGTAVADFLRPDRIVLGCDDPWAENVMRQLYAPLAAPVVVTDRRSAELIKYAANAFLAMKISYINEVAAICERIGGDIASVIEGVGLDRRIGPAYLEPGLGFGGSCLPKDVRALEAMAARVAVEPALLSAILRVNDAQIERAAARLAYVLGGLRGRRIAILGLAFKPGTDDVRESPALALAHTLTSGGAQIVAHDPVAAESPSPDVESCVTGSDAFVLATAWPCYRELDPLALGKWMRRRIVFDLRNALDADAFARAGFLYNGVGMPARPYPLEVKAPA
jgi:UDPglucose 6-dehydrogenase